MTFIQHYFSKTNVGALLRALTRILALAVTAGWLKVSPETIATVQAIIEVILTSGVTAVAEPEV